MAAKHYVAIDIRDSDERTAVNALIHDSACVLFATGAVRFDGVALAWATDATGRLRTALTSLQSYKDPLGAARRLVKRVDAVSNA